MNNDLISRSALLEHYGLKNATKYGNETEEQQHNSYSTMMLYEIADMIDDAPAVDAEPVRHGRWVANIIDSATLQVIGTVPYTYDAQIEFSAKRGVMLSAPYCELCEEVALELQEECITSDYCPSCGCKMDAEVEG